MILRMKKILTSAILTVSLTGLMAQSTFPVNGVHDDRDEVFAITGATIFKNYNTSIDDATLIIRNGRIENMGANLKIPKDAIVFDLKGKTIYPSFIDLYSNYGMPEPKPEGAPAKQLPQMLSNKRGAFSWNEALKTEFRAVDNFVAQPKEAAIWRSAGFGAVLAHRGDGISRGAGAFVTLADDREHHLILKNQAAHFLSFRKGTSTQSYPSSLMGSIALLRQTYLDNEWYQSGVSHKERNLSLEAWQELQNLPQIFEVTDKLEALRAAKIASEFGKKYIIKGKGDEYQRLEDLKKVVSSFILPLNFPDAFDVEDPLDARSVSLTDLKHWEIAPSNPARMAQAGIPFAFTTFGLKDKKDFLKQLQKAVTYGLSEADALKALTFFPAQIAGMDKDLGSLEKGKLASFIVTNNNIFSKNAKIVQNWVAGKRHEVGESDNSLAGKKFKLVVGNANYTLNISEKEDATISLSTDSVSSKANYTLKGNWITLSFALGKAKNESIRLSGVMENETMRGRGQLANGDWVNWEGTFANPNPAKNEALSPLVSSEVTYPFGAFGFKEMPKQENILFKNATVWTGEKDGVLKNTDVMIQNGRIVQVARNIKTVGMTVIDATDKHITAGVIDEHSHIGVTGGVNEGSQAASSEVRIADVINSEDINIYRQLAGGVTSSHILHGSANPIGGQTQLLKLRWGMNAEQLKFEGWDGFIKFALGENVKQSNWGDNATTRFPQTRMGVEQVYEDAFTRAAEYAALKKAGKPYRRDLETEAILEILEHKRFITCHSYIQSEINMLIKVAEKYNFKVNTFTHILEGYKVADKMKAHGAGAAGFSDWWAYKYEVLDAIPYNGALMHQVGLVTAFNSDDAEMARRLNQEAGKAIKYGKVPEEEAWKFVTLNPAKLLHVDHRVGSIKVGKDADLVLWSDYPMSVYAKAEMTFVDGIRYFDRERDEAMHAAVAQERNRLIQKMIAAKKSGQSVQPATASSQHLYHCDDEEDEMK
jgi:imidazolonepropionase-like amidohydrolase